MTVGVALSGGGTRGFAHLGMLQALQEADVTIHRLSGTSAGALGGAFFAHGYAPREILEIFLGVNPIKYLRPAVNLRGLIKMNKARAFFLKHLPENTFEDLNIPLTIAATNLNRGATEYFDTGDLIEPMLASSCLPIIFDPMQIGEERYVDGGILANLPAKPLIDQCDVILGMHCNPVGEEFGKFTFRSLLERSLMMAINYNTYDVKPHCDLFWEPPALYGYRVFDVSRATEIYEIGYTYAQERLAAGDMEKLK